MQTHGGGWWWWNPGSEGARQMTDVPTHWLAGLFLHPGLPMPDDVAWHQAPSTGWDKREHRINGTLTGEPGCYMFDGSGRQ
jgi:hypothetical protein